jgi:hypothetical protein
MEANAAEGRQGSTAQSDGPVDGVTPKKHETDALGLHEPPVPADDDKDADEGGAERPGDAFDDQGSKSAQVRQGVPCPARLRACMQLPAPSPPPHSACSTPACPRVVNLGAAPSADDGSLP